MWTGPKGGPVGLYPRTYQWRFSEAVVPGVRVNVRCVTWEGAPPSSLCPYRVLCLCVCESYGASSSSSSFFEAHRELLLTFYFWK